METKRILLICCISLVVLLSISWILPDDAEGKTWYVDDGGGADFQNIHHGIENATDGDTIIVESGTYYEKILVNKSLTIMANESSVVKIIGNGKNDVVTITADDTVLSGVSILNTGASFDDAGIEIRAENVTIRKCNISGNNGLGIHITENGSNMISDNVISGNDWYGIMLSNADNNTISNNTCYNNLWVGIILISGSVNNIMANNTCYGTEDYGILLYSDSNDNIVENNTVEAVEHVISLWGTQNNTLRDNNMSGGGIDIMYQTESVPDTMEWMMHSIDTTNTMNDKIVYFAANKKGGSLPSNIGQLILVNCSEYTIMDLDLDNGSIAITIGYSWNLTLDNITCRNNSQEAIWIVKSSSILIKNCTLSNNMYGLRVEEDSSGIGIHDSLILDNLKAGVDAKDNNGEVVNATDNWWDHISGPFHPINNSLGQGNNVTDNVAFAYWKDWPPFLDYSAPRIISLSVKPNDTLEGEAIKFTGEGNASRALTRYSWNSSIDGEFFNGTSSTVTMNNYGDIEGFEDPEDTNISYPSGGDAKWRITDTVFRSGTRSASSGDINDNGVSWMEMEFLGTGSLEFYWKISSEFKYDLLKLFLDGEYVDEISGNVKWSKYSLNLSSGVHIVRWSYEKDSSDSTGSDAGYLDDIIFRSTNTLSNGTHVISLKIEDDFGVWSDVNTTILRINGIPIAIISSITPNPALHSDLVHFVGNATEDGLITRYVWSSSIDGEIYNGTENEFNFTQLSNGSHIISLVVRDNNGVWSEEVTKTLTIKGRPTAKISEISPNPALDVDEIGFKGIGTDDGSIALYAWRSDRDGEFYNGTIANIVKQDLSNGTHVIFLKVQDNNGVWSEEVNASLVINGKPVVTISSIIPQPALHVDTIIFSAEASDDGSVARYVWSSSLVGEFYNGTEDSVSIKDLSNGTQMITVRVMDNDGTWSDPVTDTININGLPYATIVSITPDPALQGNEVTFNGSVTDDGSIVRYVWHSSLDGELYNDTNPIFSITNLSNGTHVIEFRAKDNNGTWSDLVNASLYINGRPVARIEFIAPNPALHVDIVEFVGNASDDGSVIRYVWTSDLDGEIFNGSESSFMSGLLSNGTHVINLRVQDNDGVWSDQAVANVTINGKPYASIDDIDPVPALDIDIVTFFGSGSDDGTIMNYSWISSMDGGLYSGSNDTFASSSLSNGTHTIMLRVQDNSGVWSDQVTSVLTINGKPRAVIESIDPNQTLENSPVTFNADIVEDGSIITYVWYSDIDGMIYTGPNQMFVRGNLSNGTHTISLMVEDNNGTWSDMVYSTLDINGKPRAEISEITPKVSLLYHDIFFNGRGYDDGTIIQYNWESSVDGIFYSGASPTYVHEDLSIGEHIIYYRVLDNNGAWSEPAISDLRVHQKPTAQIVSVGPEEAIEGDSITFKGSGIDDGDIARYVWTSSLDGELYNDTENEFVGMLTANGTHTITLQVIDEDGVLSDTVETIVKVIGRPVGRIVSIAPNPAKQHEPVHFIGHGTDDGSIERYLWFSSLDGEFYNDTFSEFYHDNLSLGLHTIYFQVMDDHGLLSYEKVLTLRIFKEPVAWIEGIEPNLTVVGEDIRFTGNGTDPINVTAYEWRSSIDGIFANDSAQSIIYNGLSNGTHIIYLRVLNKYGIWSLEVSQEITILRKPVGSIDSMTPDPAAEGEVVTLVGSIDSDDLPVEYLWRSMIDGVIYSGPEAAIDVNNLSLGNHTILFNVRTVNGFWSEVVRSYINIVSPNTTPTVSIEKPLSASVVDGKVTISGKAVDSDGTIQRVDISIDGGEWQPVQGTENWSFTLDTENMENGVHYIEVRAYDGSLYSIKGEITLAVDNDDEGSGLLIGLLLGIVVLLLVAAISLYLFKGKDTEKTTADQPGKSDVSSSSERIETSGSDGSVKEPSVEKKPDDVE